MFTHYTVFLFKNSVGAQVYIEQKQIALPVLPTKINATSYQGGGWESNEDDIEDSLSIVYMGNESIVSICQQFEALGMLHCSLSRVFISLF
jgi:hypothetical protein